MDVDTYKLELKWFDTQHCVDAKHFSIAWETQDVRPPVTDISSVGNPLNWQLHINLSDFHSAYSEISTIINIYVEFRWNLT